MMQFSGVPLYPKQAFVARVDLGSATATSSVTATGSVKVNGTTITTTTTRVSSVLHMIQQLPH